MRTAKLAPRSVTRRQARRQCGQLRRHSHGAVTSSKLAANSVLGAAIANGVVTNAKLGNELVTKTKIANGAVTLSKLGEEVAPLLGTLRSGQTLRGAFDLGASGQASGKEPTLRSLRSQLPISAHKRARGARNQHPQP